VKRAGCGPPRRGRRKSAAEAEGARQLTGGHPGAEDGGFKKVLTPTDRREAVGVIRKAQELSERRACELVGMRRSSYRYVRREEWPGLRGRLGELAQERRRFGYRRLIRRLTD
jgi:hypothetical protein